MDSDSDPRLPAFRAHALGYTLEPPSRVCVPHTASQTPLMGEGLPRPFHGKIKAPVSPSPEAVSIL